MTRATNPISPPPPVEPPVHAHICPFCGLTREVNEEFDGDSPCPRCTLADTPTTRNATKIRVGPWHVRQVRNPWAPGMRFDTLVALINRGQVNKDSVVRGPTTFQLWRRASEIKGLSREFGVCYSCGGEIDRTANLCPHCNRLQEPPINPDVLVEMREPTAPGAASSVAPQPLPRSQQAKMAKHDVLASEIEPPQIEIASMPMSSDPMEMLGVSDEQAGQAKQTPTRAPARDRPTPIRPRMPGSKDALLTPQELATAFQLDFSPDGVLQRRKSKPLIALAVLLLLGTVVGGVMYAETGLWEKATAWETQTAASIKSFFASRANPAKPAAARPSDASSSAAERPTAPRTDPVVIAPAGATPSPVANDLPPSQVETAKSAPNPAPELPSDPYARSKQLWNRAIDAEANLDYVEAVGCYEQIKKLPSDVHQSNLDVRLEQARKLMK